MGPHPGNLVSQSTLQWLNRYQDRTKPLASGQLLSRETTLRLARKGLLTPRTSHILAGNGLVTQGKMFFLARNFPVPLGTT